ncbi:MAG: sulfite exporter TauE/SafE family protein [Myxococcota bacterium]
MSLAELSAWQWSVVGIAGLLAGFINTVAGGGSLLTLPALMLAGLPPTVANGTNRIGILMQSASATLQFRSAGALDLNLSGQLLWPTIMGAGLGAYTASVLSDAAMEPLILSVLVTVALLFALKPGWVAPSVGPKEAPRAPGAVTLVLMGLTGFYGGFLQAGVGFLLLTVLAGTLRLDLTRANALKVALVVPYTLLALGIFAWADQVAWGVGIVLGATSMLGARLGVYVAVERSGWLRWLVLAAVVASGIAIALKRLS